MSNTSKGCNNDSSEFESVALPIVGIIIPVHNGAKYIQGAVQSVQMQDYPAKFVAMVDDGSTDDSYEVMKSLFTSVQADDPDLPGVVTGMIGNMGAVLLKHDTACGPAAARNTAIKAVWHTTHIFGFLDADDRYMQGKISRSAAHIILDSKNIGLVYSDCLIHNESTDIYTWELRRPYDRVILERMNIISNASFVSKLALAEVGLFDKDLRTCEDWDLWLRITEKFMAIHIADPLHIYTVTGQNATFTVNQQQWDKDWVTVRRKLLERK